MLARVFRYIDFLLVVAGLGAVGYGLHLAYPPSAFIVVGAALMWMGLPD